jgi:hypothetical protein
MFNWPNVLELEERRRDLEREARRDRQAQQAQPARTGGSFRVWRAMEWLTSGVLVWPHAFGRMQD